MKLAEQIIALIGKAPICAGNEKQMQKQVADALIDIWHVSEFSLSAKDRIDFYVRDKNSFYTVGGIKCTRGIGIECKYGRTHSPASILRQLKRYADSEQISQIILVSTHPIDLPATLSGKPAWNVSVHLGGAF